MHTRGGAKKKAEAPFDYGECPCSTPPTVDQYFYLSSARKGNADKSVPEKPKDPEVSEDSNDSDWDDGDLFRQSYLCCTKTSTTPPTHSTNNTTAVPSNAIRNGPHPSRSQPFVPQQITALRFDPSAWANERVPTSWKLQNRPDKDWPPKSPTSLLNIESTLPSDWKEARLDTFHSKNPPKAMGCVGKYLYQTNNEAELWCPLMKSGDDNLACGHTFKEWYNDGMDWQSRFELRAAGRMGTGVFTKVTWSKDDILGVYLGELIPRPGPNSDYCQEINIGPSFDLNSSPSSKSKSKSKANGKRKSKITPNGNKSGTDSTSTSRSNSSTKQQDTAIIDAEAYGNWTRFVNHHCENNTHFVEMRVGTQRVLALVATRRIKIEEQIFADYGEDYFKERWCYCGSEGCRKPPPVEEGAEDTVELGDGLPRHSTPLPSPPDKSKKRRRVGEDDDVRGIRKKVRKGNA